MSVEVWDFGERCVGPKAFEVIMRAGLRQKYMGHNFTIVDYNPFAIANGLYSTMVKLWPIVDYNPFAIAIPVVPVRFACGIGEHLVPDVVGDCRHL